MASSLRFFQDSLRDFHRQQKLQVFNLHVPFIALRSIRSGDTVYSGKQTDKGHNLVGLVGGPQGQVVPEQLHDERRVLVGFLGQRVQLGDGIIKSLASTKPS